MAVSKAREAERLAAAQHGFGGRGRPMFRAVEDEGVVIDGRAVGRL